MKNPCLPSPCGPNSECRDIGGSPSCSCIPNYIGSPPNCRPECTISSECPSNLACIREKCLDPCPGSCGVGAQCNVFNHIPTCICLEGLTGDPFTSCNPVPPTRKHLSMATRQQHQYFCLQLLLKLILAIPHHAVQIRYVIMVYVRACPTIKVIHTVDADLNACLIMTALVIELASAISV